MNIDWRKLIQKILSLAVCFAVPVCRAQYVIDSLDGEVTQHEVDTFIQNVSALPIPTVEDPGTSHNVLADGQGGVTLEAINDMYRITGDIPSLSSEHMQLLNLAIAWTDTWLIHRNDLPLGEHRVMWTGKIEPVWPPNCSTCSSSTYYESEVGDTIGHMGYTAYNILNTPSIWNDTVPDGDPNNFGTTYLARAKTYVSMLEFSMSNSFTPYFIDPSTLLIRRPSVAQGYQSSFHNVNAWNVEMMLLNAYQRLAQCHGILGDNPSLVTTYQTIVRNSTDMFVQNALPYAASDGTTVYNWGYCNSGDCTGRTTGEDVGHGQYDMWGLTRAYRAGYTGATAQQMKTYADTVVHKIADGPNLYFAKVDGSGGTTQNYLLPGWFFLTPYNTNVYRPIATAAIDSQRQATSTIMTSGILWMKHWIFTQSQHGTLASYEAEAPGNTFSGTVATGACSGCSGGQKVRLIGNSANNYLVINNIIVPTSGNYTLTIYYVVSGTRSFSISVNGGAAIPFTVSGTTWNGPGAPVSVTIPLNAGSNSIKFFNDCAFAPDMDRITIQ